MKYFCLNKELSDRQGTDKTQACYIFVDQFITESSVSLLSDTQLDELTQKIPNIGARCLLKKRLQELRYQVTVWLLCTNSRKMVT